jgi:hypothetical protein
VIDLVLAALGIRSLLNDVDDLEKRARRYAEDTRKCPACGRRLLVLKHNGKICPHPRERYGTEPCPGPEMPSVSEERKAEMKRLIEEERVKSAARRAARAARKAKR